MSDVSDPRRPYLETTEQWASFLSAFVHELRTPIASLKILGELMQGSPALGGERERLFLENMQKVVRDLLALVGDAGELGRLIARKATVRSEAVDLGAIFEGVEETLRPRAWDSGIGLQVALGPETADPIHTDRELLRRMLTLLVGAAVQHARSEVVVRADVDGGRLSIVAASDGSPLPDPAATALFQPFGDGQRSAREHGGGSLTLPLANEVALALGGVLRAENRGKRPAFVLELPVRPSAGSG
ncbi:MAG TPA: HAMP domain-containing sensor histidine kinase [Thermoanaerobaculia bacterium]